MTKVHQAEAYRYGAMGSMGNAAYMLIRQYQFPDEYEQDKDKMRGCDHDRIMQQWHNHGERCFREHTGAGELCLEEWIKRSEPEQIIIFMQDIMKEDPHVKWTGFRVLGTVHRGNGYPVWTLELFSKHPESGTAVFNTENAPNIIRGSRYAHR